MGLLQSLNKSGAFTFVSLSDFLSFSDGLTPVKTGAASKYGYIDKQMKLAIPVSFEIGLSFL